MLKDLVSSENVDAIFIDGKYQDSTNSLSLNKNDIRYYQYSIKISTDDIKNIEIFFHSFDELREFIKVYELEGGNEIW